MVTHGQFRWIRHPNYVAIVLELRANASLACRCQTMGLRLVPQALLQDKRLLARTALGLAAHPWLEQRMLCLLPATLTLFSWLIGIAVGRSEGMRLAALLENRYGYTIALTPSGIVRAAISGVATVRGG